ncbi:hypothetical protein KFK14_19625 [Sphingobium phenoxybenzoativorans]|uniref:Uncharacterized protein n=1 Tax=Sphingobium phenoxybenzoativorans TaxID=1592790 RepID=A0A975K5I6_9SPHN|nr:hypothetical protein [Sphingobium phenoxybenzoativorans]QUT05183.1 hypothetical protein KFK14_19625 [Sphingobium phenoxybenzoativorans]
MTIWEEVHRGYGISYGPGVVRVRRPGETDPIDAAAYAEPGESRQDLRQKAKALIEADRARPR